MSTRPRVFVCARVAPESEGCPTIKPDVLAKYADDAMRHAIDQGAAPFPWRGYTHILDDSKPEDRAAALESCLSWLPFATELWVFADLGISQGMMGEIAAAEASGIPVMCWYILPHTPTT